MKKYKLCRSTTFTMILYTINDIASNNMIQLSKYIQIAQQSLTLILLDLLKIDELDWDLHQYPTNKSKTYNTIFEFNNKQDILDWMKDHPEELI